MRPDNSRRCFHRPTFNAQCFRGDCMRKILLLTIVMCAVAAAAKPEQASPHQGHGAHEGTLPVAVDAQGGTPDMQAKILADEQESEFNHHLAGFFVALGAVFMLFHDRLTRRWPPVKYLWPACFLLSGLFVLVWSDTQLWPFGGQRW